MAAIYLIARTIFLLVASFIAVLGTFAAFLAYQVGEALIAPSVVFLLAAGVFNFAMLHGLDEWELKKLGMPKVK